MIDQIQQQSEAAPGRRQRRSGPESEPGLILDAAKMHLDRVAVLSSRNWNADVLYWTALLISGSTLLNYATKSQELTPVLIYNHLAFIIGAYLVSIFVYHVLVDRNKYRSLVTERNRYQMLQDVVVARAAGPAFRILGEPPPSFGSINRWDVLDSSVWGAKLIASFMFVSGIFFSTQAVSRQAAMVHIEQARARSELVLLADQLAELERAPAAPGAGPPLPELVRQAPSPCASVPDPNQCRDRLRAAIRTRKQAIAMPGGIVGGAGSAIRLPAPVLANLLWAAGACGYLYFGFRAFRRGGGTRTPK